MNSPYDINHFREMTHILEYWNFHFTTSLIRDSRFPGLYDHKALEFGLILELALILDEIAKTESFRMYADEMKQKVIMLERALIEALQMHI